MNTILFTLLLCISLFPIFENSVQCSCESAAAKEGNACLLNESKDGVSCDVENNKCPNINYLEGKSNTLSLPDNKHNNKNARGQVVTGTSPCSLGSYVLDPWMLKLAEVVREHYRIKDWASDTVVERLCSSDTIVKLLNALQEKKFDDVGNCGVLVVTLLFIRLCNYSVNAKNVNWKDRCMYQWCSLLWFSSFHTPYR